MNKNSTLAQARLLQRLCFDAALSYQAALPTDAGKALSREGAQALAALVKSWDTARDAARVARGRPLPGSLTHRAERRTSNPTRLRPRPPLGGEHPAELDQALGSDATRPASTSADDQAVVEPGATQ